MKQVKEALTRGRALETFEALPGEEDILVTVSEPVSALYPGKMLPHCLLHCELEGPEPRRRIRARQRSSLERPTGAVA